MDRVQVQDPSLGIGAGVRGEKEVQRKRRRRGLMNEGYSESGERGTAWTRSVRDIRMSHRARCSTEDERARETTASSFKELCKRKGLT